MNRNGKFENEIDLIDYIKLVYKKRLLVAAVVIAGVFYGGISEMRRAVTYEAMATFFPLDSNFDMKLDGLAVKTKASMKDLVISILNSKKMADRIIEQLDLKKAWGADSLIQAQRILKRVTDISSEQNGLIMLTARTGSAELSANIANAYVDNLDYFNQQLDIGVQRRIVQVIDRATVPDEGSPRHVTKKAFMAGIVSFASVVFLLYVWDFIKKSDLLKRLKE